MARTIKVGTRGSALALAQTELMLKKLAQFHPDVKFEKVVIKTKGDKITSPDELRNAGKGLFVKEIDDALLKRKIDFAVHSAKDLPGELTPGVALGAVPEREEAADLFIARLAGPLEEMPIGSQVGTSSLRRQAFLRAHYRNVAPVELRGNLDTRLEKLFAPKSKLAGIIVAAAGVRRLKPGAHADAQTLPKEKFVPAAGQGALALTIREKDEAMRKFLAPLHHDLTYVALAAEREVLRLLEGGCQVPLGVHAEASDDGLVRATAAICSLDGRTLIRESSTGTADDIPSMADALVTIMKSRGAADILFTIPGRAAKKPSRNGHKKKAKAKSRR